MSRKYQKPLVALWLVVVATLGSARAQEKNSSKPEPTPTTKVLNLWPGVAPGSEEWKQQETTMGSAGMETTVNVVTPTLTVYLPDAPSATGAGIIIAPGGGFIGLSIKSEGHDVAKWLVARGFAAIVLKYRTKQIEGKNAADLGQSARAAFMAQLNNHALIAEDGQYGVADGSQAVKVVRAHATEWGIAPDRVVFTGFSAGGMITELTAIQSDVNARPNYAAPIYALLFRTCLQYQKKCRPSSWPWRKTTTWRAHISSASTRRSRPPDTTRNFTSITTAVTAGACANKARRATTGSTSSTGGWKCKG
jgi:hypothetical protein